MKIKTSMIVLFTLMGLVGCTSVRPVVATGYANQYTVEAEGATGFVPLNAVYLNAQEKAKAKCKELGQNYHQVSKELISTSFGVFPMATIIFECNNNLIDTKQKILLIDGKSLADKLKTIENLYNEKIITKEEYLKKRSKMLNEY